VIFALIVMFGRTSGAAESESVSDLRAKAEAGDARAGLLLALRYDNGEGVPLDRAEAAKWYLLAAEAGLADAQNSIGSLYEAGEGVAQDSGKAAAWYRKSSDQGNMEATHNLGYLYDLGKGLPEENERAVALYTQAAEKGFVKSMLNLGVMYAQGDGIPKDELIAYMWLDLARFYTQRSDDMQSKRTVRGLLDDLRKQMSRAEISRAEKMSKAWDKAHRPGA
jgi:hypothetical protein